MYATLSHDYSKGRKTSLLRALRFAIARIRSLFFLGLAGATFLAVAIAMVVLPAVAAILFSLPFLFILSTIAALFAIVAFALVFLFAIPSAVLEKRGSLSALSLSFDLGRKNRKEIVGLNLIFFLLVLVTLAIATATEMKGGLFFLSIAVFVVGRLLQALIYTYISVAMPTAYLVERSEYG